MKVLLLAGGFGTRIFEESHLKPKPMIEIGSTPILVHIMRLYDFYEIKDFVICAGYKQQMIKEYFNNFDVYTNDVTFNYAKQDKKIHNNPRFEWNVTVVDTGLKTQTGGRILKAKKYIQGERFMVTYGDAVGNVDIKAVLDSHIKSGKKGTICVYNFGQSKGVVDLDENGLIKSFREKSDLDGDLINIGFMVFENEVLNMIDGEDSVLEKNVLQELANEGELNAYIHKGFWQCMDTIKEKELLESLDKLDNCPWKVWDKQNG